VTEHMLGIILVCVGMLLEAAGQICLKQAADRDIVRRGLGGFLARIWRNRWIGVGVACFIIEYGFYTAALRYLPLSIAFPPEASASSSWRCCRTYSSRRRSAPAAGSAWCSSWPGLRY